MSRRDWRSTFTDPVVLSDLFAAARECHAEVDDCDPETCAHREPMMFPIELPQWIEGHVQRAEAERVARERVVPEQEWRGVRSNEPAGRPNTRRAHDPRNLARAG